MAGFLLVSFIVRSAVQRYSFSLPSLQCYSRTRYILYMRVDKPCVISSFFLSLPFTRKCRARAAARFRASAYLFPRAGYKSAVHDYFLVNSVSRSSLVFHVECTADKIKKRTARRSPKGRIAFSAASSLSLRVLSSSMSSFDPFS